MEKKQRFPSHAKGYGKILIASLFILSGVLLLARNMGWITPEVFDILVSWQSLLIITGIYSILNRHYIGGVILLVVGSYFLCGNYLPEGSQALIWPLALICGGILFLIKGRQREHWFNRHMQERMRMRTDFSAPVNGEESRECESENGFLRSNNVFGASRHVVLDEVFKGATIYTSFGGTTIDLRHTHLAPGETYIDLDCSCGGVEMFIPTDWKVVIRCNAFFGGCEDKRWQGGKTNTESVLVIRGTVSFGGLEVKD